MATTRSGPALTALGHVCQGLGLNTEALQLMDRARATGYDNPDFRYFRALQLQFNGRMEEAEEEMERCLRMAVSCSGAMDRARMDAIVAKPSRGRAPRTAARCPSPG